MTTKSKIARALRRAAEEMERRGAAEVFIPGVGPYSSAFTCNIVGLIGNTPVAGDDAEHDEHGFVRRCEYAELFDMDSDARQKELWNIHERNPGLTTAGMKAMMLGFAAAMVETGDLPA